MTRKELEQKYDEEMEKIKNAPSIGAGDAMVRSMAMNELRRWYEREIRNVTPEVVKPAGCKNIGPF